MSTLQTGFGADVWGEDGFQTPEYLEDYDEGVIRTTASSRKRMHAPDLRSDEPQPACEISRSSSEMRFVVAERENIEGFYAVCSNPECQQFLGGGSE